MQNEMRDRLVNLINQDNCPSPFMCSNECKYAHLKNCCGDRLADHLIENSVIVPPCELGSEIYMLVTRHTKSFEWENKKMILQNNQHTFIKKTTFTKSNFFKVIEQFGKTVFLTKEEAEQKLKGGVQE